MKYDHDRMPYEYELDEERVLRKAKRNRRRDDWQKRYNKNMHRNPRVMFLNGRSTFARWWRDEWWYKFLERWKGPEAAANARRKDASLPARLVERGRLNRFIYNVDKEEFYEEHAGMARNLARMELEEQMDLLDAAREGGYCGPMNECHSYYCKPCNEPWWLDDDDDLDWLYYPEYWEGSENEFPPPEDEENAV